MKYFIIIFLCFIVSILCKYNCSITTTPRIRCKCFYGYIRVCTGNNNSECILSCIPESEYNEKCLSGEITGDISKNKSLNCSYVTSIACSFPGIQFPCLETDLPPCPARRMYPLDTSFVVCACDPRLLCEQTGAKIMNENDPLFFNGTTYFGESCDQFNISLRIKRDPAQPMNMNRGLMRRGDEIRSFHHHVWSKRCNEGWTTRVEINQNCTNGSLLIQCLCPTNFSFVCNISNNISICVNNAFDLCIEGIISFKPCESCIFPSTTGNPIIPGIFPSTTSNPIVPSTFPSTTSVPPFIGFPIVPTPLNGINCSDLVFIQGNCTNGMNASCCFENFTFECITQIHLVPACLILGCRPLLENEICEKPVTPPISPITPSKKDDPLSTLGIILIVLGSVFVLILICIIGNRIINRRRRRFDTVS